MVMFLSSIKKTGPRVATAFGNPAWHMLLPGRSFFFLALFTDFH